MLVLRVFRPRDCPLAPPRGWSRGHQVGLLCRQVHDDLHPQGWDDRGLSWPNEPPDWRERESGRLHRGCRGH